VSCDSTGDCPLCCHGYCPEAIEEIKFQYTHLKEYVKQAEHNLEELQKELVDFVKDNKEILIR